MANHIITKVFNAILRKFETTDRNHADVFNAVAEQLINNDAYLKEHADTVDRHLVDSTIHVTEQDKEKWNATNYGSCSTAAATVAKVVACTGFKLVTGAEITVKFTVTNTAANPTLNVNSTGAKAIYYRGAAIAAGNLAANRTYTFRYNGTQYELVGDINTDNNTTYSAMTGATTTVAGTAGLVPAPAAGTNEKYLRGDGTWQTPPDNNTTYSNMKGATTTAAGTAGLVPAPSTGAANRYLRSDGTWQVPPDNNTTYNEATTSANGLISAAMVTKLNGIATGADVTPTGLTSGYVRTGLKPNTTVGNFTTAEGYNNTVSGAQSHSEGYENTSSGSNSHSEGYKTTASNSSSHSGGKYNAAMTTGGAANNKVGHAFVIGNGTSETALSNALSVMYDGTVKAASTITASTAADYAEFFEWLDGNLDNEDRVGHFVTLDGEKIRYANSKDYILGIVSGEPFVLGNGDCDTWNGMFLRDEFNRLIQEPAPKIEMEEVKEEIEVEIQEMDEETGEIITKTEKKTIITGFVEKEIFDEAGNPVYEGTRPKLNPDYDPNQAYISRFDRAEWSPVGMLGVLSVYDDGSCEVNGYCKCNDNAIATKAESGYRVIKRVSKNIVRVVFR